MKIDVRQEFIDAGVPCDSHRCPIALATLGDHAFQAVVTRVTMGRFAPGQSLKWIDLPDKASQFTYDFDSKGAKGVKPFSFEIDL